MKPPNLISFESEDDWFDYRLENDPQFAGRIASARASLRAGCGMRLEDLEAEAGMPDQALQRTRKSRRYH